jgi:hypothetical protein
VIGAVVVMANDFAVEIELTVWAVVMVVASEALNGVMA